MSDLEMTSRTERPSVAPLLNRGIERALAPREEALVAELNQIIEATYRVIARTETVNPPLRDILSEAKLSTPAFYRHFRSKDELLVGLLDQGWTILREYLHHQMAKATTPREQIAAWIRGMLAQATDPTAAQRARPFVSNLYRLATEFPVEFQASRDILIRLLDAPVLEIRPPADVRLETMAIYDLVKAEQERHLIEKTTPSPAAVEHTIEFVLAALDRGTASVGT